MAPKLNMKMTKWEARKLIQRWLAGEILWCWQEPVMLWIHFIGKANWIFCQFQHKRIGGTMVKNLPAHEGDARDSGSILESERSPGLGNGNWLLCSCLENSMDSRAWWAIVHEVKKSEHVHQRNKSWGKFKYFHLYQEKDGTSLYISLYDCLYKVWKITIKAEFEWVIQAWKSQQCKLGVLLGRRFSIGFASNSGEQLIFLV